MGGRGGLVYNKKFTSMKNDVFYKIFGDLVLTHMVVLILKFFEKYGFFSSPLSMLGGGFLVRGGFFDCF